jgi:hypothetical protein
MSVEMKSDVDRLLRIHTGAVSYAFSTLVEQAVVVLGKLLADSDPGLAPAVAMLPDFIRYGVHSLPARNLMVDGLRHRRAANLLGDDPAMVDPRNGLLSERDAARALVQRDPGRWRDDLGQFVYQRTARDLGLS